MYLKTEYFVSTTPINHNMATQREIDTTATPDERAPLLAPEHARYDADETTEDDAIAEAGEATSNTWLYLWRGFWVLLAILIIAVFIKGWIDADDVNVSAQH
jgi:hypothetical protein